MRDRPVLTESQSTSRLHGDLYSRRESLERRLEDGYLRIEQLTVEGGDISEWESFWIKLLSEYEDVCREMDAAA